MFDTDLVNNDVFSDSPPEKVFFQIVMEYDKEHEEVKQSIPEDSMSLESEPLTTYPYALEVAEEIAEKISKEFPSSCVAEPDDEDDSEEGHFFVVDQEGNELAKVSVYIIDLRRVTFH